MPQSSILNVVDELSWVRATPDEPNCGCRHVRMCDTTRRIATDQTRPATSLPRNCGPSDGNTFARLSGVSVEREQSSRFNDAAEVVYSGALKSSNDSDLFLVNTRAVGRALPSTSLHSRQIGERPQSGGASVHIPFGVTCRSAHAVR